VCVFLARMNGSLSWNRRLTDREAQWNLKHQGKATNLYQTSYSMSRYGWYIIEIMYVI